MSKQKCAKLTPCTFKDAIGEFLNIFIRTKNLQSK